MNRVLAFFLLFITVLSCKNDDVDTEIPQRLLSDVAVEDDLEIQVYLKTHFYNYEEFSTPPDGFDQKIKFDTIAGGNVDKIPLWDQVEMKKILVASSFFGLNDGEEIEHTLYYLEVKKGSEGRPTVGDNVVLQYEGSLLDGSLFDSSLTPINQYLPNMLQGYANGVVEFSVGKGPFENGDGTVRFEDHGIGAIFIPSGLAYFNRSPNTTTIPFYSPLIFKLDVLAFEEDTDFDDDGIPSILEDLNNDGNLNNDNTDADIEGFGVALPNHNDPDDDNDGILTRDEIEIDSEGNITFPDSDGDGIKDYLDNDS